MGDGEFVSSSIQVYPGLNFAYGIQSEHLVMQVDVRVATPYTRFAYLVEAYRVPGDSFG